MKTIILLCLSFYSALGIAQEMLSWNNEVQVANGTSFGNTRPRIVLTKNDIPLVVFSNSATMQIYAARWNGSSFSSPVSLLPQGMSAYVLSWTGPDVAAKGDTVIVVFKADPIEDGNIYAVRSIDGGLSFSDTIRVDNHNAGVAWMPSLDIDENGNPSVIYMAHDSLWVHPRYVVAHSSNTGLSFDPSMEITLSIPDEACDCCPAEYVIKDNREVLLYRNNESNIRDIFGVYSTDFGSSYNSFEQLNQLNWLITSCPSTGPHGMFRNNELLSVSMSRASGKNRVYITSTVATNSIGASVDLEMTAPSNVNGSQNYPRISGNQDTVVMAWQESNPSNPDVYCAFTTTGNINDLLTTKALVNQDITGTQTNPDLVYKNGKVHYVFQDALSGTVIYKWGSFGMLGVEEVNLIEIQLFPNPTASNFVIKGIEFGNYELKDLRGMVIKSGVFSENEVISLDIFPAGMYVVEIQTIAGIVHRSVVKR